MTTTFSLLMIVGNVFSVLLLPGPIRDREALAAISGEEGKGGKDG